MKVGRKPHPFIQRYCVVCREPIPRKADMKVSEYEQRTTCGSSACLLVCSRSARDKSPHGPKADFDAMFNRLARRADTDAKLSQLADQYRPKESR